MENSITFLYYFVSLISVIVLTIKLFPRSRIQYKNLPPSPSHLLPILGHLHLLKEPLHRTLLSLSENLGPVFSLRLGSSLMVVVSSQMAAEECFYGKNDIVLANRPKFALGKYVGYNYTTLALAPYGDHWRNLRRLATVDLFSSTRLNTYSGIRRDEVHLMLRRLYHLSSSQGRDGTTSPPLPLGFAKVELKTLFTELTFNVIMRMVAGKKYYGDDVSGSEEARKFREVIEELFALAVSSYPGDFFPVLKWVDYNGYMKRARRVAGDVDAFLQGLVDEHRKKDGSENNTTMIDHLLSLQQSEPDYYTDDIIKGLASTIITAGTDTTAATLEWAMASLLNNPRVLEKARAEIDSQFNPDQLLQETDIPNLQFLQNIISETFRLYPAGSLLVPHMSSAHCTVNGYDVPPETTVMVNAWAIHREPAVWERPERFWPERFEEGNGGGDVRNLLVFGIGRRACPGMGLANRVLGLALGSLIQCFEWEREGEEEVDMTEADGGLTMRKLEPLVGMCRARPHIASWFDN